MASKVPGWVERILIPTLETKIRSIVGEELAKYGKTVDAKFEGINSKMDAKFDAINSKMDAKFEAVAARLDGVDAKLEALNSKMDGRFDAVDGRLDSLEKRLDVVKEIAEIKARLDVIEKANR